MMATSGTTSFTTWLTRRILIGILTLFVVMSLTFFLLRVMPGSPFDTDKGLSPIVQQALEARFKLNEPLWVQYGLYLKGVLVGNFGPSLTQDGRTVNEMLRDSLSVSLIMGALALSVGTPLGVGSAILHAKTQQPLIRRLLDAWASLLLASPSFLIAGVLILTFSVGLGWFPAATLTTPLHWVLPVVTLSAVPFTFSYLLMRQAIADEASALYLLMKQASGIQPGRIMMHHLLRNAWLPLLSLAGPLIANVMTGSFAIEVLYAIPGMGRQFIQAIINRDYTVVLGATFVYALALLSLNIVSDATAAWLDPRLREAQKP
jgi:oligopeptide transport system permease protein